MNDNILIFFIIQKDNTKYIDINEKAKKDLR